MAFIAGAVVDLGSMRLPLADNGTRLLTACEKAPSSGGFLTLHTWQNAARKETMSIWN
jgi:hypothetical protein